MLRPGTLALSLTAFLGLGAGTAGAADPSTFEVHDSVSGPTLTGLTTAITVYFNPKEYTIDKSVPWKKNEATEGDSTGLSFESAEAHHVEIRILFDGYGTTVTAITDRLEKLVTLPSPPNTPPPVLVTWHGRDWTSRLIEARTRVLERDPAGTPIVAETTTLWGPFTPVDDDPPPPNPIPAVIATDAWKVPAVLDGTSMELLTLKKDGSVKGQSVSPRPGDCFTPTVDVRLGDPQRFRFTVDLYAAGDVRPAADLLASLTKPDPKTGTSPRARLLWNDCVLEMLLENLSIRYTLFLPDGTPTRATVRLTLKEATTAKEQLQGNPRH